MPDLVAPTRELLKRSGLPYVIENVPGAPLENAITSAAPCSACGRTSNCAGTACSRRSFAIIQPQCQHQGEAIGVYGGGPVGRYTFGNGAKKDYYNRRGGYQGTIAEKREAMGIDWMTASDSTRRSRPPTRSTSAGSSWPLSTPRRSWPHERRPPGSGARPGHG
jgi:DNA (cytosine-5)-methyltransferase 1